MCHIFRLFMTDVKFGVEDFNCSYYEIRVDVYFKKNIIESF